MYGIDKKNAHIAALEAEVKTLREGNKPDYDLLKVPALKLDDEQKQKAIDAAIAAVMVPLMHVFYLCDLDTNIEAMVKNDEDGKEFILSFQTTQSFLKRGWGKPQNITDKP